MLSLSTLLRESCRTHEWYRSRESHESAQRLAERIGSELRRILADAEGTDAERLKTQVALVNDLLLDLRKRLPRERGKPSRSLPPFAYFRAVHPVSSSPPTPPETELAAPWCSPAPRALRL
jgi:hypothetical protein